MAWEARITISAYLEDMAGEKWEKIVKIFALRAFLKILSLHQKENAALQASLI